MKKLFNILLIIVVTFFVLYFSLKEDYQAILNTIFSIHKGWLLLAFLFLFGYWFFKSVVTYLIARRFSSNYRLKDSVRLTLETNFFHAITPFSSGGQPYEIYSLSKHHIKVIDATNISIGSFIVYQIDLVLLGIVAIVSNHIWHLFPNDSILRKLVVLGFIINLFVIVLLFILTFTKKLNRKLIHFGILILTKLKIIKKENLENKVTTYLEQFHRGAKTVFQNKKEFFYMLVFDFIALVSFYLVPFPLFKGVFGNLSINAFTSVVTMAYVMLIGSFVPIPGGTGGLEYGFIAFFKNLLKGTSLNAVMLLWRFITYFFGMIIGAILLNIRKEAKK